MISHNQHTLDGTVEQYTDVCGILTGSSSFMFDMNHGGIRMLLGEAKK